MKQIDIKEYIQQEKKKMRESRFKAPYISIIDPTRHESASQVYISNIVKDCEEMGWKFDIHVCSSLDDYSAALQDSLCGPTGIIVLQPSRFKIPWYGEIPANLDIDATFSNDYVLPATVRGVMDYLTACEANFKNLHTVVLGRGKVGLPMAETLIKAGATVSVCHSRTPVFLKNGLLHNADLVVSTVGKPNLFSRLDVNEDTTVIDVGISAIGKTITGDFMEKPSYCKEGWSTPVPGGVGLLTRLALMKNAIELANREPQ